MKKRVLKPWVKVTLLLLPEMIIIGQLFFIGAKIDKLINSNYRPDVVVEMRCHND